VGEPEGRKDRFVGALRPLWALRARFSGIILERGEGNGQRVLGDLRG